MDREPPRVRLRRRSRPWSPPGCRASAERADPLPRAEEQGTRCSAYSARTTGQPHIVRRFRGGPNRSGVWDGQVSTGPERPRPAPEGDYAFKVAVRDRAGNETEAPAPGPARGGGTARHRASRCAASRCAGPLAAVAAGALAHLEVGPVDRSFDCVLSRLGEPKADPPRRPCGRALPRPHPEQGAHRRLHGARACGRGPRGLAARRGRAPAPQRAAAARGRSWCCPRSPGRASTASTTTSTASPTRSRTRPPCRLDRPFARRRAAAALRRRGVAAAALPRPRAARLRPHDRSRARATRGPSARQRPRRGLRRQRAVAAASS